MKNNKVVSILFFLCILSTTMSYLVILSQKNTNIFIDEPAWITSGLVTKHLYQTNASTQKWETEFERYGLGFWGNNNPPIGKFLIGVAASFETKGKPIQRYWRNFSIPYFVDVRKGNITPFSLVKASRLGIVVMAGICLLFCYMTTVLLIGFQWYSGLPPLLLFLGSSFRYHASIVMTEIPQLMFLLAAIFFFLMFLRKKSIFFFLLASICVGLGCAVKLSSGFLVLGFCLFCLFGLDKTSWKKGVSYSVLLGVLSIFFYGAVNPYLYTHPIEKTRTSLKEWKQVKEEQRNHPQLSHGKTISVFHSFHLVFRNVFWDPFWATSSNNADLEQNVSTTRWFLLGLFFCLLFLVVGLKTKMYSFLLTSWKSKALFSLLLFGLVAWNSYQGTVSLLQFFWCSFCFFGFYAFVSPHTSFRFHREMGAILFLFGISLLVNGVWLPLDWGRYYIVMVVFLPYVWVFGFHAFGVEIQKWLEGREKEWGIHPKMGKGLLVGLFFVFVFFSCLDLRAYANQEVKITANLPTRQLLDLWHASENKQDKKKISSLLISRFENYQHRLKERQYMVMLSNMKEERKQKTFALLTTEIQKYNQWIYLELNAILALFPNEMVFLKKWVTVLPLCVPHQQVEESFLRLMVRFQKHPQLMQEIAKQRKKLRLKK